LGRLKEAKEEYLAAIKYNKDKSWKKFTKDNQYENPWGLVNKLAREKVKVPPVHSSRAPENGAAMLLDETVNKILNRLVPNDTEDNETEEQKRIRAAAFTELQGEGITISDEEVSNAIFEMSSKGTRLRHDQQRDNTGRRADNP
jgi:hypothetical protein